MHMAAQQHHAPEHYRHEWRIETMALFSTQEGWYPTKETMCPVQCERLPEFSIEAVMNRTGGGVGYVSD
jgi:hypothetical protein